MSSSSDEEIDLTKNTAFDHLPQSSKQSYMKKYDNFMAWKKSNNILELSEDIFLMYFKELAEKYKPTSLWCTYSMLKNTLISKSVIDITKYSKLLSYVKDKYTGCTKVQAKVLTSEEIEKFLKEAPDELYLATKVALIFGVSGACSRKELHELVTKDVTDHGKLMHVMIRSSPRSRIPSRSFVIEGCYYGIVKKYHTSRVKTDKNDRYFQNYQNGKCTCQPIGINKFGSMPKRIARYLGLPDANSYTGHSFKRTSATLQNSVLRNAPDVIPVKRRRRKVYSKSVGESYEDPSNHVDDQKYTQNNDDPLVDTNTRRAEAILENLETTVKVEISPDEDEKDEQNDSDFEPSPSTSLDEPLIFQSNNEESHPEKQPHTTLEYEVTEDSDITPTLNSILKLQSKSISLHFNNCTFINCFISTSK